MPWLWSLIGGRVRRYFSPRNPLSVQQLEDRTAPAFTGGAATELRSFFPFDLGFRGGVSVATGDVTGDGAPDIVTGTGPGGSPQVKVFDGTGAEVRSLLAFEPWFRGGVNVADDDVTGDGVPDVVAAAGKGGGPRVSVFDGVSGDRVRDLFAFDKGFAGGVNVSAVDLTGDGAAELVAAAGPGGGPHVKVFELADAVGAGNFPSVLAGWDQSVLGGSGGGKGSLEVVDGILTMREGDSFRVGLSKAFAVPDAPTAVRVTYESPTFDTTSAERIKDAFEVAVLGADGSPLALPVAPQRDASLNWTEQLDSVVGADADQTVRTAVNKVTINLSALPPGTAAKLVLRLVNDDTDQGTTVRVRRVDFISAASAAPAGRQFPAERQKAAAAPDLAVLSDVTPSARFDYGRTTLTDRQTILTADVGVRNAGTYPMAGRLVVTVGNLSDPSVGVLDPDGYTPDGRPFFDFTPELNGTVLLPGRTTAARTLRFTNPNRERFTYDLQVLAGLDRDPVFTTDPVTLV